MSLVEAGSLVGGVIGSPVSLDMKKVDEAPPPSTSRLPQQPAVMGGGGTTAQSVIPVINIPHNSAFRWEYYGSAATNK